MRLGPFSITTVTEPKLSVFSKFSPEPTYCYTLIGLNRFGFAIFFGSFRFSNFLNTPIKGNIPQLFNSVLWKYYYLSSTPNQVEFLHIFCISIHQRIPFYQTPPEPNQFHHITNKKYPNQTQILTPSHESVPFLSMAHNH